MPPPLPPVRSESNEDTALAALVAYKPSLLDWLLRRGPGRRRALELAVSEGRRLDDETYDRELAGHAVELARHRREQEQAAAVARGDLGAWADVLKDLGSFGTISMLGSEVAFQFARDTSAPAGTASTVIGATVQVHSRSVVPDYALTRTMTGKLSQRKLSKTDYHALHQDYVCACALRVARETLNLLPASRVVVTCVDEALDGATGQVGERVLLSVRVSRRQLDAVNLAACDPSEALSAMEHRMSFAKTRGFRPVEPLDP